MTLAKNCAAQKGELLAYDRQNPSSVMAIHLTHTTLHPCTQCERCKDVSLTRKNAKYTHVSAPEAAWIAQELIVPFTALPAELPVKMCEGWTASLLTPTTNHGPPIRAISLLSSQLSAASLFSLGGNGKSMYWSANVDLGLSRDCIANIGSSQ